MTQPSGQSAPSTVTTINMSGLSDEESHRLDYWCHLSTDIRRCHPGGSPRSRPGNVERRPWLLGIQRYCFVDRRNELLYYMTSTGLIVTNLN